MANEFPPGSAGKAFSVFGSDLSLAQQKEQLLQLIADYSERLQKLEDGEEKSLVSRRISKLTKSLTLLESQL